MGNKIEITLESQMPNMEASFDTLVPDIEADFQLNVLNNDHNKLENRDLPNQHPIEAITDLRDILNKLWTFTFEQGVASDTWEIQHNLGRHPSVVVVDSANSVILPDVEYVDENKVIVRMIGATTGKAFLN